MTGVILAHAALGTPFVVITVTATLVGFDQYLDPGGADSMGADMPTTTFFKVIMPLILPGVISGALFAFITSFDEVVVVLFIGRVRAADDPTGRCAPASASRSARQFSRWRPC
ncbi:MAG: ABC transporter permease [Thalassobaculum sp.]